MQLGHGDAYGAMMNPSHEIRSHFASPPFITRKLQNVPGAHVVTDSAAILGSPLSTAIMFTTTRFADQQPVLVKAVAAASAEAVAVMRADPGQAARDYLDASNDRIPHAEVVALLGARGMEFDIKPEGTLRFAEFLNRIGTLRTRPKAWTEYFLPDAAALGGS